MHTNPIDFTREAAEQGDENTQYFLASFHHFGRAKGIPKDCAKAAHWYRKAAEQGHADAQYSLGVLHMSGDGVPQDFAEAVRPGKLMPIGSEATWQLVNSRRSSLTWSPKPALRFAAEAARCSLTTLVSRPPTPPHWIGFTPQCSSRPEGRPTPWGP